MPQSKQQNNQQEVVRALCEIAIASDRLLRRLGTKDNPVQSHYEKEFYALEMASLKLGDLIK